MRAANPVLAVLVALTLAAAFGLGFVTHAPNRLLTGVPVSLLQALTDAPAWLLVLVIGTAAVLLAGVVVRPSTALHAAVAGAADAGGFADEVEGFGGETAGGEELFLGEA